MRVLNKSKYNQLDEERCSCQCNNSPPPLKNTHLKK